MALAEEATMRMAAMVAAGLLAAAGMGIGEGTGGAAEAPWGSEVSEPTVLLARLHRAALHEVELGSLAQESANSPDARQYGAELAADFHGVDQRIVSLASGLGIAPERMQAGRGEDAIALRRDADRMSRLAGEHGPAFDRDYWVTVAESQARESDLLATTATREPALTDLVTQMSRLYDRSSRLALDAAQAAAGASPTETPPTEQPAQGR